MAAKSRINTVSFVNETNAVIDAKLMSEWIQESVELLETFEASDLLLVLSLFSEHKLYDFEFLRSGLKQQPWLWVIFNPMKLLNYFTFWWISITSSILNSSIY